MPKIRTKQIYKSSDCSFIKKSGILTRSLKSAIKKGASVIICSKNCKFKNKNVLIIKTKNTRYLLSEVASRFYKLKPKNIIAVTGTNGKTSVADIFFQILKKPAKIILIKSDLQKDL